MLKLVFPLYHKIITACSCYGLGLFVVVVLNRGFAFVNNYLTYHLM